LRRSYCAQVFVDKLDRGGPLSHRRCDALDGAAARVEPHVDVGKWADQAKKLHQPMQPAAKHFLERAIR